MNNAALWIARGVRGSKGRGRCFGGEGLLKGQKEDSVGLEGVSRRRALLDMIIGIGIRSDGYTYTHICV